MVMTETNAPLPEPTSTITITRTPAPVTYNIKFLIFHDYDGNGTWDLESNEPPIPGIAVHVGDLNCLSGSDGTCIIGNIIGGTHRYLVQDQSGKFRWILPSVNDANEVSEAATIELEGDIEIYLPLAEGRMVLPFTFNAEYFVSSWYDRNINNGIVENWFGEVDENLDRTGYSASTNVQDGHYALDFLFTNSTPIVAADAGRINRIIVDSSVPPEYNHSIIGIDRDDGYQFDYGHVVLLESLREGQRVKRGDVIGYAGERPPSQSAPTGAFLDYPYIVHFGINPPGSRSYSDSIDPFLPNLWTISEYDYARVRIVETQ